LLGAVATKGGVYPNAWNKFVPRPIYTPPHPKMWNETTWPREYPLSMNEMSFLLPHFLKDGRAKLDVYFTRVYNPVWTNPDGFSWIEMLTDPDLVGCYVALTPTWNETAYYADYVLPMGVGSERHDLHSYETHDSQWLGFRQPVMKARATRRRKIDDTRDVNPGEVWEENEFWLELTWRIDPDGSLGIRQYAESKKNPGHTTRARRVLRLDLSRTPFPVCPSAPRRRLTPLEFMRRYGASKSNRRSDRFTIRPCRRKSSKIRRKTVWDACLLAPPNLPDQTSSRCRCRTATQTDVDSSASTRAARSSAASRRRAAVWNSIRRR
jgi:hypothetical protein